MKETQTTKLKLDALREKDLLISNENEFFEVDKALGQNILCCKNELAFRLKSLDHKNRHKVIIGQLNLDGILFIVGFKKHQPHSDLN